MYRGRSRTGMVRCVVMLLICQLIQVGVHESLGRSSSGSAYGGEFNEVLAIGEPAPDLEGLMGVDEKPFDPKSSQDADVVVIAFTCNTCPYAMDYESRLIELAQNFKIDRKSVVVLAINSNDIPADSLAAMKARAEERKYSFGYLKDSGQVVARKFGASKTPEFFVLDRDRKVVYMGAFDDNTDRSKVTAHYVKDAVEAVLAGTKVDIRETPPVGCRIRAAKRERK